MDSKVKQGSDNRWTAPLPFRKDRPVLPNNRVQAVQRVNSLERSLRMNPNKKEHILEFMNKMFVNKHAEKAPNLPIGNECWYLPFFGVYHPKKPGKVRIVFDSSAKFSGTSLNDVLIKGPDLTNNLLGVLLRFRKEAVAVTADVEQMFYNFKVTDSHSDYLRFVWHENNEVHRPLIDYRMTVHVLGNSPSPSVATYCFRRAVQNADNDIQDFVYNNFYVDDGLMSCPDVESAVDLMKRTQKALVDGGGLRLHKFVSNSKAVLQSFPSEDLSSDLKDLDLGSETPPVQRSLGLSWDISVDQFTFKVSSEKKPYTRRGALSVINSIFDPIGFASPITMNGKLILREMMSESGPANWDEDLPDHLFSRLASWKSLVRAIQFLKAFISKLHQESPPSRQEVEQFIIKTVQAEAFLNDINAISSVGQLLHTSNLLSLSPVLDKHNILRVGGRIRHAKTVELHLQPIIIPKKHHLAVLLTRHYHELTCHQGRHMTEGALRSRGFWVIGRKRLVSTIIRQCVTCKKLRGQFKVQKMSDLPEDRLTPGPPFTFVGIDTFGPYQIIHRKTRGSSINQKRWAILFTCLVSRAIHIEVIEEMSSASFINAYRRFIAIRGSVKLIRSDRGTNFVGAIQDLGITAEFIEKGTVDIMLSQYGTIWKFNPPHASHVGGSWERMIGLSRRILACMLIREKNRLTHEMLVTLMAEVSAIVNSRPLVSVSTDPDNPEVLSPSMLLTHKKGQDEQTMLQFGTKDMLRSQWKMVQGLADEFWSKWNKEYLHTLQVRKKWELPIKDLNIGDIVLMRDKELPRPQWPMAIVTKVFPSADMKIRKVGIRTIRDNKPSSFIRPIVELIPLVLTDPK
ncbi:uncharacterized protein [Mytilus edulis]|uniref:uncharacterized protein n=1 Tax=Mytilus edulis TaxID=6550 RepID=UPI0039F0FF4D